MTGKTFIKITNKDIYEKLTEIEKNISKVNGAVKFHTWAIGVLFVIIMAVITKIL